MRRGSGEVMVVTDIIVAYNNWFIGFLSVVYFSVVNPEVAGSNLALVIYYYYYYLLLLLLFIIIYYYYYYIKIG